MEPVHFSLFGALRVHRGDRGLPLGTRQQRLLLALLLARPGEPVSISELIDGMWGDRAPRSAANVIYRYVGSLRRLLEPDLPRRSEGTWLLSDAGTYALRVDDGSLDLLAFRAAVARSRRAEESGDVEGALHGLVTALDLWREECAHDLGTSLQDQPAFVALENERTRVVHEAADLALRAGRPGLVLPALRRSADRHLLDEALQARLMVVLAADGKQAESIQRYRRVSELLADELGVDVGADLTAARQAVLRQADGGDEQPVDRSRGPRPLPRPAQLPTDHPYFAGRQDAVQVLLSRARGHADAVPVLGIDGIPGMGKTTLAVHVAHRLAEDYPDGQLYLDLRAFDAHRQAVAPAEALQDFLSALGVVPPAGGDGTDALSALYRSVLADRRVLILLDNADDADQVRPLLPGNPHCLVLVTSRSRLSGLATSAGAQLLTLGEPDQVQAREMFAARTGREWTGSEAEVLDAVIEHCGRLPLALALVNARAADQSLSAILAELRSERRSLEVFADENLDNGLRAIFSWSYQRLTPEAGRLFRLLSAHPGPDITVDAAAALAGTGDAAARDMIGELMRTRLVTQHRRSRYRLHVLVQAYAAELAAQLDPADEIDAARRRLSTYYLSTAQRAKGSIENAEQPGADPGVRHFTAGAAMQWFVAEYDVLRALTEDSAARGETQVAGRLVLAMQQFHQLHGWWQRWRDVAQPAFDAAVRAGDDESSAHLGRSLAGALHFLGDNAGALAQLRSAGERFDRLGMHPERAQVLTNTTRVMLAMGDIDLALEHHQAVVPLLREHDLRVVEAGILVALGYYLADDRPEEAERFTLRAIDLYEQSAHDSQDLAACDEILARVALTQGRPADALDHQQRCVDRLRGTHNRLGTATSLMTLSEILAASGKTEAARTALQDAVAIFDDFGVPASAEVQDRLRSLARKLAG